MIDSRESACKLIRELFKDQQGEIRKGCRTIPNQIYYRDVYDVSVVPADKIRCEICNRPTNRMTLLARARVRVRGEFLTIYVHPRECPPEELITPSVIRSDIRRWIPRPTDGSSRRNYSEIRATSTSEHRKWHESSRSLLVPLPLSFNFTVKSHYVINKKEHTCFGCGCLLSVGVEVLHVTTFETFVDTVRFCRECVEFWDTYTSLGPVRQGDLGEFRSLPDWGKTDVI